MTPRHLRTGGICASLMWMPWEPLPGAGQEPTPVRHSLDLLMNRLAGTSLSTIEIIMDSWVDIVGVSASQSTSPVRVDNGRLTVRADTSVWVTELRWLEPTIIERVGALAGGTTLTSVKVVVSRSN